MCLDGGKGKRLQRAKTYYVTVCHASPIPTECGSCSSRCFGRFWVTFGGGRQSLASGLDVELWDATAASIFIELRAAPQLHETHPSSNWDCFASVPRTSSERASSYNRCLKKGDLRSSRAGKETIWFASWSCLRRKSQQKQSHTVLSLCQSLHPSSLVPQREKHFQF